MRAANHKRAWIFLLAVIASASISTAARSVENLSATKSVTKSEDLPVIGIILDDMGSRIKRGTRAIQLPGPVAYAFLPHNTYTIKLAKLAHSYNKEILLHLPMQSIDSQPLGPGGLSLNMTHNEFVQTLQNDLKSVPHVTGINNHMGSLLTRHPGHMLWLMQAMHKNGELFFVDSRTTSDTVALKVAGENGIPSIPRNIFLDHDRDIIAVNKQFDRMIQHARKTGTALAIGHPYKSTLSVLEERLPELESLGIRLVPVSEMIKLNKKRKNTWQASLSRSPRAAKN